MKDDYVIIKDFILQYTDSWVVNPISKIVRRLVLLYMATYESKGQNNKNGG